MSKEGAWTQPFRVLVTATTPRCTLDNDFWPRGIVCRQYYRNRPDTQNMQDVSGIEKHITFSALDEVDTALEYFKRVFEANIIQKIADQTNLFSVQENEHSVNTNCNQMNVFLCSRDTLFSRSNNMLSRESYTVPG